MVTFRERWICDGLELTEGNVRDVEYRAGLLGTAPMVGENGSVPNRSGVVWRPKRRGAGAFVLNVWVGTEDGRDKVERLYENVIRAVGDGSVLPTWTRYLADGSVRECRGEVASSLSPTPIGQTAMRFGIEVTVPSGIWEGTVDAVSSTPVGVHSGDELELTEFGYVTAPMERLTFQIRGPATDPKVTDVSRGNGESFQYFGTIGVGTILTVESETWGLSMPPGNVDRQAFVHSGPRFMTVRVPRAFQVPTLKFEFTNGNNQTHMTVVGRPAFAV